MESPDLEILYVKKLKGILTSDEEAYLVEHFRSNPKEKKVFEDFKALWLSSASLSLSKGVTRDERWRKLQQKIIVNSSPEPRINFKLTLRYAASIAFVVAVIGIYFFFLSPDPIIVHTPHGETRTITLPDQSIVTLNAGTTITYDPSSWDRERLIHLQGEAYFDVEKNGRQFVISCNNTVVNVLGTTFNVRSRHQTTTVTCLTGKVRVGNASATNAVILTPGTGATVTGTVISGIYKVPAMESVPWLTGDLSFNNTPLKDVLEDFERYFNVSIHIKKDLGKLTFTGKFKNPQLKSAIETVCLSAGLKYSINKTSIIIE